MNKEIKIKIEDFIERLNNHDFKQGTKFKFLDKIYLYDYPNLTGIYEIDKPTKPEYSIFAQFDITNLQCEIEIIEEELKHNEFAENMNEENILYALKLLKSKEWNLQELDNAIDILLESWCSYNQIINLLLLDGTISDDELRNYYIRRSKEQNPDYNKYLDYLLEK